MFYSSVDWPVCISCFLLFVTKETLSLVDMYMYNELRNSSQETWTQTTTTRQRNRMLLLGEQDQLGRRFLLEGVGVQQGATSHSFLLSPVRPAQQLRPKPRFLLLRLILLFPLMIRHYLLLFLVLFVASDDEDQGQALGQLTSSSCDTWFGKKPSLGSLHVAVVRGSGSIRREVRVGSAVGRWRGRGRRKIDSGGGGGGVGEVREPLAEAEGADSDRLPVLRMPLASDFVFRRPPHSSSLRSNKGYICGTSTALHCMGVKRGLGRGGIYIGRGREVGDFLGYFFDLDKLTWVGVGLALASAVVWCGLLDWTLLRPARPPAGIPRRWAAQKLAS